MVAAIFEAAMSREQAERLAVLMRDGRATRPAGVLNASLLFEPEPDHISGRPAGYGVGRLVAIWQDKDTLDRYLSVTPVPRGTELMRAVGVEPAFRVVEALECG